MPQRIIRPCIVAGVKPYQLIAALMAREGLGPLPLAKRLGKPALQPQIHRFISGSVVAPKSSTAAPLAAYFNLPLEAIYDEKIATEEARARGIGEGGQDMSPQLGVMPAPLAGARLDNIEPGPETRGRVPLISWVQAGTWAETCDVLELHEVERWLDCFVPHSACTAALRVRGDSMTALTGASKSYPEGCIIFVDFEKKSPVNGQRIVAKIDGGTEVTFKVFKDEDSRRWLQPLNPSHEPIRDPFKVLGTVIGKWEDE